MDDPRVIYGQEKVEYITECECVEVQEQWQPTLGDEVFDKLAGETFSIKPDNMPLISKLRQSGRLIFLPSIYWLAGKMIDMYPERRLDKNQLLEGVLSSFYWINEKSPRLALLKELKSAIGRKQKE